MSAVAVAGAGCVLTLAGCSGGGGGASSTATSTVDPSCVAPRASSSAYSSAVQRQQRLSAAAQSAGNTTDNDVARARQGQLQQAWAAFILAHQSCFDADTVAAAKEYQTGPGG